MRLKFRCFSPCRRIMSMSRISRSLKDLLRMILKMWKQECGPYTYAYDQPQNFSRCHWQKSDRVTPGWIAYRATMAVLVLAGFIYSVLPVYNNDVEVLQKYPIFLTHWTFLLETIVYVSGFALTIVEFLGEKNDKTPLEYMNWYLKLYWMFYNVVLSVSVVVTVTYFGSIYDPAHGLNLGGFIVHVFNSIIMVADFFLIAFPIRGMHFHIPLSYGIVYCVFTIIYQLCGGTGVGGEVPIYKIIDWRKPWSAALSTLLIMLFVLVVHFSFSILHIFKVWVKKKEYKNALVV